MRMWYVYTLFNSLTNEPMYVGYGHGRRMYTHRRVALCGKSPNRNNYEFGKAIRELITSGGDVIYKKDEVENLESAKLYEIRLISKYGRRDIGTGTLYNLTNGGDGRVGWSDQQRASVSSKKKSYSTVRWSEIFQKRKSTLDNMSSSDKLEWRNLIADGIRSAHKSGKYKSSLDKLHSDNSIRFRGKGNPIYRDVPEEILSEAETLYKNGWGYLRISRYFRQIKKYEISNMLIRSKLIRRGILPRTSHFKRKHE